MREYVGYWQVGIRHRSKKNSRPGRSFSICAYAPKQAWAELHLHTPVELNRAPCQALLRVPGIGPKSADRIIAARRETRLHDLAQLRALGVRAGWAAPYVPLDGRRAPVQAKVW